MKNNIFEKSQIPTKNSGNQNCEKKGHNKQKKYLG
jgi:hypothetical protein